jgi:hypothetical protein
MRSGSGELLDLTVERVRSLPVLLMVTFRPEFQPPWTGQPQVTMLALNRLDRHDRTVLVEQIAGGKPLPDDVIAQIVERTDGVPLFVEELTREAVEIGGHHAPAPVGGCLGAARTMWRDQHIRQFVERPARRSALRLGRSSACAGRSKIMPRPGRPSTSRSPGVFLLYQKGRDSRIFSGLRPCDRRFRAQGKTRN